MTVIEVHGIAWRLARAAMNLLAQLPQFGLDVQCFVWPEAKSFHYICFWIIFEGSESLSFSRRICWWSLGFETQRVRIF